MTRQPAVADRFYPGDAPALGELVNTLLTKYQREKTTEAIGVVSPHAGYMYSGDVCAETLSRITIPETVVILGPNHHGLGASIALSQTPWKMAFGTVPIDESFSKIVAEADKNIQVSEAAHQFEHSLEVQIPFLQKLQKNLHIVPLALSHLSLQKCKELGKNLAEAIDRFDKAILLLASSDMNHFASREIGSKKDNLALTELLALKPEELYATVARNSISMCGVIPVTVVLYAALQLGADTAELIRYCDSGDVSGDIEQVVGYAGVIIK